MHRSSSLVSRSLSFLQLTPVLRAQRIYRPANHITEQNTPHLAPAIMTRLEEAYHGRCTRCGFENIGRRDRRLRNFTDEPDQLTAALLHTLAAY
jgi:hypothetical protein